MVKRMEISQGQKYLIMKKIVEYLRMKGGKALMTNVIGNVAYLADWKEIEEIVYELQQKGILEISPVWHDEYIVTLKKE